MVVTVGNNLSPSVAPSGVGSRVEISLRFSAPLGPWDSPPLMMPSPRSVSDLPTHR